MKKNEFGISPVHVCAKILKHLQHRKYSMWKAIGTIADNVYVQTDNECLE